MPLEGKVNPMLKGALTKEEFLEEYSSYIADYYISSDKDASKNYHYDYLYNQYLEAYKYDEYEYSLWLKRRNGIYRSVYYKREY